MADGVSDTNTQGAGYFMLIGANKYLNKMTNYAVGLKDEVANGVTDPKAVLASSGARYDDEAG